MNWGLFFIGFAVLLLLALCVYIGLCWANVEAKFRNALVLKELLDATAWGDFVQLIRTEDYVAAVLNACDMVLEEAG